MLFHVVPDIGIPTFGGLCGACPEQFWGIPVRGPLSEYPAAPAAGLRNFTEQTTKPIGQVPCVAMCCHALPRLNAWWSVDSVTMLLPLGRCWPLSFSPSSAALEFLARPRSTRCQGEESKGCDLERFRRSVFASRYFLVVGWWMITSWSILMQQQNG